MQSQIFHIKVSNKDIFGENMPENVSTRKSLGIEKREHLQKKMFGIFSLKVADAQIEGCINKIVFFVTSQLTETQSQLKQFLIPLGLCIPNTDFLAGQMILNKASLNLVITT